MSSYVKVLPQGTVLYCCGKNNWPYFPEVSRLQDYLRSRLHCGTKLDTCLGEILNAFEGLLAGGLEWTPLNLFLAKNLLYYIEYDHDADNSCKHLWNSKMVVRE
jgi:hypothetical protein